MVSNAFKALQCWPWRKIPRPKWMRIRWIWEEIVVFRLERHFRIIYSFQITRRCRIKHIHIQTAALAFICMSVFFWNRWKLCVKISGMRFNFFLKSLDKWNDVETKWWPLAEVSVFRLNSFNHRNKKAKGFAVALIRNDYSFDSFQVVTVLSVSPWQSSAVWEIKGVYQ